MAPDSQDRPAPIQPLLPRWMPFLLVVGLIGMAARQGFRPIGDPDTWWHLRLGDDLWRSWNFTDPAPWTRFATEPWVTTQWLPEVIASRAEHAFGLPGVVWLLCAGLVLLAAVLYLTCRGEADVLRGNDGDARRVPGDECHPDTAPSAGVLHPAAGGDQRLAAHDQGLRPDGGSSPSPGSGPARTECGSAVSPSGPWWLPG